MGAITHIVGNWKMNGSWAEGAALAEAVRHHVAAHPQAAVEVTLCPPATLLLRIAEGLVGSEVKLGAQDCSQHDNGAHTGDISAAMLKDAGVQYVILGHSERRRHHGEHDALIQAKALAARAQGLKIILCVGENLGQREAGKQNDVVRGQLLASLPDKATPEDFLIAYEPVWAIGTGKSATRNDIESMHAHIFSLLEESRSWKPSGMNVLYGGSVKATNAKEILDIPGVGGVLVGGASLHAEEFCRIIDAAG